MCPNSALYIRHYQKAHGSVPPEYSEKDLLICDLCPKMFPTERGLKHHLKTGHVHEKIQEHKFKAIKKGIIFLLVIQVAAIDFDNLLKVNRLKFRFMESLHNTDSLRNLNFCAHSERLLRKLNHVLLWILSNDTGLVTMQSLCSVKKIVMTSNVLP